MFFLTRVCPCGLGLGWLAQSCPLSWSGREVHVHVFFAHEGTKLFFAHSDLDKVVEGKAQLSQHVRVHAELDEIGTQDRKVAHDVFGVDIQQAVVCWRKGSQIVHVKSKGLKKPPVEPVVY